MKNVMFIVAVATLTVTTMYAQQWSDVGDPGFTSNHIVSTNPQYAAAMAMYNDVPHMAFVTTSGDAAVMRYSGGTWSALPSPLTGTGITFVHLAFDAAGNVYLGYLNSSSAAVVKKYNGTSWSTVGPGASIVQDNLNGLAINPVTQEPYVAVYDGGGTSKASVYRFNGTNWVTVGAAQFSSATQALRLAISSTGVPYLTLQNGTFGTTFSVQKFDGTNWVAVGASTVGNLATTRTDLAIDGSGTPFVFSINPSNSNRANVLKFDGTNWVAVGQADFSAGGAEHPCLRFDNSGTLHLAYQDAASANGANKATVMKFNGTSWVGAGSAGFSTAGVYFPTLAFNSTNLPYVGYRDAAIPGAKGTVMKLCSSNAASVTSNTPGSICGPGTVTLSATSSGTLRWYNAATNGSYVGTGTSYTTPSLTVSTTYSVAAYDNNGCSSARTAVTATVNAIPTITASNGASRCGSGTLSLSGTASVGNVQWFTASTGGSTIGTGSPFTTPSITNTTTYYVEANNNGCLSASRTAVVATVKTLPGLGVGFGGVRCGTGTVDLSTSAFPTGATVTWFTASSGGASIGSGDSFTTPSISNTTTFYAEANFNGCVSTARQALLAEVRQVPAVTSTAGASRCGPGTVTLTSATNLSSQSRWFDAATGGNQLAVTTSFNTPVLDTDTDYFVEAYLNGCASPRTAVTATITPIPAVASGDITRCDPGNVTFEGASPGAISWYDAPTGGNLLGTGPAFTTPDISTTTSYYAEAVLNGCLSTSRTQVQAIVVSTPSVVSTVAAERCGPGTLTLSSTVSALAETYWYDTSTGGSLLGLSADFTTPSISTTTTYYVEAFLTGCPSVRTAVTATIKTIPTITTAGASRCDVGTLTLAATSTGDVSWFANASGGSALATGASFTTPSLAATTDFFAEASQNGCVSARAQAQAVVIPRPSKPVISQNNTNPAAPVLTSSASASNQWFKDGNAINGATSTTYTITGEGQYTVQTGTAGCLSVMSDVVQYVITALDVALDSDFRLYPNPATRELILDLRSFARDTAVQIELFDFAGRKVIHSVGMGGREVELDVRGFNEGTYIVRASQHGRQMTRKFIKSHK